MPSPQLGRRLLSDPCIPGRYDIPLLLPSTRISTPSRRSYSASPPSKILMSIRAVVMYIGKDALGYSATDVGTHSLRSAAMAMAMYLASVPVFTIMLIGR